MRQAISGGQARNHTAKCRDICEESLIDAGGPGRLRQAERMGIGQEGGAPGTPAEARQIPIRGEEDAAMEQDSKERQEAEMEVGRPQSEIDVTDSG